MTFLGSEDGKHDCSWLINLGALPAPTKLYLDIELGDAALSNRNESFDSVLKRISKLSIALAVLHTLS